MRKLGIIFPDQVSANNIALTHLSQEDALLIYEPCDSFYQLPHHKQKIAFLVSALRHRKEELAATFLNIKHEKISKDHKGNLMQYLEKLHASEAFDIIHVTHPGDHQTLTQLMLFASKNSVTLEVHQDTKFIGAMDDFTNWSEGKKSYIQEYYYRWLRKKYHVLMDGAEPIGGKWNFDKENQKSITRLKEDPPTRPIISSDALTINAMVDVEKCFSSSFGSLENFNWAVTHDDAKAQLQFFLDHCLDSFGDFQDAMDADNPTLFHSLLSPYINIGLLDPSEVIASVIERLQANNANVNAVEGFVRQVLGWREFMRGIYWMHMPQYKDMNFFDFKLPLPDFYWTGDSGLACVDKCVKDSSEYAYSHHIQRLMITGNLSTLIGIKPSEISKWYLSVYADAHEWVETPNTIGMASFADGGIVGSKPYISSGNYINKMSNFCKACKYNVKNTLEEDACPFNYMYWNFLITQRPALAKNHRMALAFNNLDKKSIEFRNTVMQKSEVFIKEIY